MKTDLGAVSVARVAIWLGYWRDEISPKAVAELQDILESATDNVRLGEQK